jgi:anti-anti-sigma factor
VTRGQHDFSIRTRPVAETVQVIEVAGELDLYTGAELQAALDADETRKAIVVDLSSTTFVDSTALGILVHTARRLQERARQFAVVSDDTQTRRVFKITGLDRVLTISRTLDDALERLGSPSQAVA